MIVTTTSTLEGRPAMAEMQKAAEELGANAIVGVSLDLEGVGSNGSMLLVTVSGTAVVVAPA